MQIVVTSLLLIALSLLSSPALRAQTTPNSHSGFAALAAKADAARDAERLDEALALYRKALALRPAWAEGWWSLGTIQYDRNAYAEAARAFEKVTVLAPKNGTAYVMLGLSEFELGRDELALQHIQKGKDVGVDKDVGLRHVVLYHEAVLLQRKGKFEAAQETLEQLCRQGVQSGGIANVLGMTLLRLTSKNPPPPGSADANVVVRVGRSECLAGQKKYDEARPGFEAVVKENPTYPNIHYAYGLFLLEVRDLAGGVEQLKQEVNNNPTHVLARLRIAAAQYKEDSAAGIPYAEEAVKLAPQMGFAHYLLGLLLLDTNDYERALPELEIAQKAFPREAKLYMALGSAYSRAGRKQEAARARAMFERLTKEGATSTLSSDEAGLRGTVQQKIEKDQTNRPPQ
ncbi:MAG: tetratricopeptide repeat protein [Acidobacteriia bacterium]|nr:tetratricopeptide repeat protein [Terriglobia bacterium]